MGKNKTLFAKEKVGKLLLKFSIPIIIAFLVSELYNMVDTVFIGRTVGEKGIGALVVVFPIQRIIIALSIMIAIGTSVIVSRANGEGDKEEATKAIQNGFFLATFSMLIIGLFIYFFSEEILIGLGARGLILSHAKEYLSIILIGAVFLSLTIFIAKIMLALGNGGVSIISTSIGAISNVILDIILVVKLNMGIEGAAIATASSQFIGFLYAYYFYRRIKKVNKMSMGLKLNPKLLLSILSVGLSAFIIEAEDGIVMAILNNILVATAGDRGIVVLGIISKIYMFLFVAMFGIASAMQPIAAYNMGAQNYERTKDIMNETRKYSFIVSLLMWLLGIIFAPRLMAIFVKDSLIIEESARAFRIIISAFPFISVYYISIFYFQAQDLAKKSIAISLIRQLIILLPLAIILAKFFELGEMGVWMAYPISDIISGSISYILLKKENTRLNLKMNSKSSLEKVA